MFTAFWGVVDYLTYRLRNRQDLLTIRESLAMSHLKHLVDGMHPSFYLFDCRNPIRLLAFLAIHCDTFDIMVTSESASVHLLPYLLGREANDVHAEQFGLVDIDFKGAYSPVELHHGSWPHVIHALLRRIL